MGDEVRELSRDECLARLRLASIGRVAVTHQALPAIVPVNYVVDHGIVFRTKVGGMLDTACRGTVVAFEVDELAADGGSGWSVLVVGIAEGLTGGEEVRAGALGLVSALVDPTEHFVRISFGRLSGREIGMVAAGQDGRPAHGVSSAGTTTTGPMA